MGDVEDHAIGASPFHLEVAVAARGHHCIQAILLGEPSGLRAFQFLTGLIEILDLEIKKVTERLKNRSIVLELDSKAKDFLVEKGFDPVYGARPMRRAVERFLEDPLAEEILRGKLHDGLVNVTVEGDKLVFSQKEQAAAAEVTQTPTTS